MSNPLDCVRVVPEGTGMAILLENGQLNPTFVHALMHANKAAATVNLNRDQWQGDSDMIFNQITHGDFPTLALAHQAVLMLYMPDPTISRSGIAHALGRLERHYAAPQQGDPHA